MRNIYATLFISIIRIYVKFIFAQRYYNTLIFFHIYSIFQTFNPICSLLQEHEIKNCLDTKSLLLYYLRSNSKLMTFRLKRMRGFYFKINGSEKNGQSENKICTEPNRIYACG